MDLQMIPLLLTLLGVGVSCHFLPRFTRPGLSRTGVGFTLNFGSIWSWLLLGVMIVFPRVLHYIANS